MATTATTLPVTGSITIARTEPRERAGASVAAFIGGVLLLALVACSAVIVVVSADRPSFLVPPSYPGFFPSWMAGPLGGLLPNLTRNSTILEDLFTYGLIGMYVAYVVALVCVPRMRARWAICAVLAVHILFFLSPPLALTDIFNYLNYARMEVLYHLNPYATVPILEPHSDASFPLSNWHHLLSPYGPLFTILTFAIVPLGLAMSFWAMKVILLCASLGTITLVWRCAGLLGRNPTRAIVFAGLNPVVLVWGLGGDHNDPITVFFIMLGMFLLLRARARHVAAPNPHLVTAPLDAAALRPAYAKALGPAAAAVLGVRGASVAEVARVAGPSGWTPSTVRPRAGSSPGPDAKRSGAWWRLRALEARGSLLRSRPAPVTRRRGLADRLAALRSWPRQARRAKSELPRSQAANRSLPPAPAAAATHLGNGSNGSNGGHRSGAELVDAPVSAAAAAYARPASQGATRAPLLRDPLAPDLANGRTTASHMALPRRVGSWLWPLAPMEIVAGMAFVVAGAMKASAAVLLPVIVLGLLSSPRRMFQTLGGMAVAAVGVCVASYVAFGAHIPDLSTQGKLITLESAPNLLGLALGQGGETTSLHTIVQAALVVSVALCGVVAWRRRDLVSPAGWATLALLLALSWELPWYMMWLLPLAALSKSRPLQAIAVLYGVYMILAWAPLSTHWYREVGFAPQNTALGAAHQHESKTLLH